MNVKTHVMSIICLSLFVAPLSLRAQDAYPSESSLTTAAEVLQLVVTFYKGIGDSDVEMPNLPLPVTHGKVWWTTAAAYENWEVEVHRITGHARLLRRENDGRWYRYAWGGRSAIMRLFNRMKTELEKRKKSENR